jgi:SAM-dependent methyltransferase
VFGPSDENLSELPLIQDRHTSLAHELTRHDLACINMAHMRGLEIGPLAAPRVLKSQAHVFYVDHTDTDGLRHKYSFDPDMKDRLSEIIDVDYVVGDGQRIYDVVANDAPFDFVMASHLIEHIPDPITWFGDIAKVLRSGGILSLVIPDKRYSFDINRRTTEISEIVDAYLRKLRQPSYRQVYDFISKEMIGRTDAVKIWAGTTEYSEAVRSDGLDPDVAGFQVCKSIEDTDHFVDVHCSVFTPESFVEVYEKLVRLGLIDFEIAHFVPTEVNNLEFFVSLRLLDPALDRESRMDRQLTSIATLTYPDDVGTPVPVDAGEASISMVVSEKEQRWIIKKRRIIERARGIRRPIDS